MKTKIAVLGGGAGSLFAVWDLMKTQPDAYDITVYQMGWRLGGKGASGVRATDESHRIEEHGLHFMFGFYENVFRVVREAYLKAYPAEGENHWKRFFRTSETDVAMIRFFDEAQSEWEAWSLPYPQTAAAGQPGDPNPPQGVGDGVKRVLLNMWAWLEGMAGELKTHHGGPGVISFESPFFPPPPGPPLPAVDLLRQQIDSLPAPPTMGLPQPGATKFAPYWHYATDLIQRLSTPGLIDFLDDAKRHDELVAYTFKTLNEIGRTSLTPLARQKWEGVKEIVFLVLTCVKGVVKDLFFKGKTWFALDEDFREWIDRHGGHPDTPIVLGLYDAVFATYSKLSTGAILQAFTKAAFNFKGGAIFKMQAGMGDTIFTPLYLALRDLGVKFEFFHRVEQLSLSADKKLVDTITVQRQREPLEAEYDPFGTVDVRISGGPETKLHYWPSEAVAARIQPLAAGEAEVDLESDFTDRVPTRELTLRRGVDFDITLLGISVAALPEICPELLAEDPAFKAHVESLAIATCATQAMQLWTVPGKAPVQPKYVVVPFSEPYDTVTDMRQLLYAEKWSEDKVEGLTYLCSAIDEAGAALPKRQDKAYPSDLRQKATAEAKKWVTTRAPVLWKNLRTAAGGFDWSALYDPQDRADEARFEAQWVSTPTNLSDRYVIPTPGTHAKRLMSNGTRFRNLYITGDWILNSLSIGCLESAAMGGLQAARAISLELGNNEVPRARGDWIKDVVPR